MIADVEWIAMLTYIQDVSCVITMLGTSKYIFESETENEYFILASLFSTEFTQNGIL